MEKFETLFLRQEIELKVFSGNRRVILYAVFFVREVLFLSLKEQGVKGTICGRKVIKSLER
jgi:hypothetical protein